MVIRLVKMNERPFKLIKVPSLGKDADELVDGLGLSPSSVLTIHSILLEVLQDANGDGNARDFTNRLIALGMPLLEAALIWDAIKKYPQLLLVPVVTTYREKLDLGVL